jgi:hypothetical protein
MIFCECGDFIKGNTFKAYIKTSLNPSTPTVGHCDCGLIFNFIDERSQKKYSSKTELKIIAKKFSKKKNFDQKTTEKFLIEIDRIKSTGKYTDDEILFLAFKKIVGAT